jgi:hypothetical protein
LYILNPPHLSVWRKQFPLTLFVFMGPIISMYYLVLEKKEREEGLKDFLLLFSHSFTLKHTKILLIQCDLSYMYYYVLLFLKYIFRKCYEHLLYRSVLKVCAKIAMARKQLNFDLFFLRGFRRLEICKHSFWCLRYIFKLEFDGFVKEFLLYLAT